MYDMIMIFGTSYDLHLRCFLHFFQILIFGVNSGVKGQNIVQNVQKLCLLHSISQEAYIMIVIFGTHL